MCVTDESAQGFPVTLHNTNTDDTLVCQSIVLDDNQFQGDYWCPQGYEYNLDQDSCIIKFFTCDSGFTGNLSNGCDNFLVGDSWWNQYTDVCFVSEDIPLVYSLQHNVRDRACCFANMAAGFETYQIEEVVVY
jgi:hypothetical protein